MPTNQRLLRTSATTTPAPIPTLAIVRGTRTGNATAPATGVTATTKRRAFRFTPTESEPLGFGFAGRIAVVFGGDALEIERDVSLLLTIGSCCFNGIHLLAVTEWNLNAEGSIAGQWHFFSADGESGGRISGAVNDQLGICHQPEGALARGDSSQAGFTAAAGP